MKKKKLTGNVRDAALSILWAVENQQAYSNLLLNDTINKYDLSEKDRGLLTELTYGTLQRKLTLDFYLKPYIKGKLEPWVKVLLRLTLYQMVYLDRVPDRAAIHEAVEIAKKRGHQGIASTVNGILRSVQRNGTPDFNAIKDPIERIAVETSHPAWLIGRWVRQYGEENTVKMAMENNNPPLQTVRVNTMKASPAEAIRLLEEEGLTVEQSPRVPECLFVSGKQPAKTEAFQNGIITVQDESSMLPVYALQAEPGMTVLDMCAAPGGKTTHIAEKMKDEGTLYAMDLHAHKVKLIKDAARRLGHTVIQAAEGDGRQATERFGEKVFDRILVDAPCSGLGVIKRKPDIKYTKKEEDFAQLQSIQLALLSEAVRSLKDGGLLVYSTCTVDREENEGTVDQFLKNHPEMEKVQAALPEPLRRNDQEPVQIFPHDFGGDGFFVSSFQKRMTD